MIPARGGGDVMSEERWVRERGRIEREESEERRRDESERRRREKRRAGLWGHDGDEFFKADKHGKDKDGDGDGDVVR